MTTDVVTLLDISLMTQGWSYFFVMLTLTLVVCFLWLRAYNVIPYLV